MRNRSFELYKHAIDTFMGSELYTQDENFSHLKPILDAFKERTNDFIVTYEYLPNGDLKCSVKFKKKRPKWETNNFKRVTSGGGPDMYFETISGLGQAIMALRYVEKFI